MAHDRNKWFSAKRAAKLADLSPAMVNYLCRAKIVEPSCDCPRGYGRPRHYSFGELVALRVTAKLTKAGVSVLRLRAAMQRLSTMHPKMDVKSLPSAHLVTDGKDLYIHPPRKPLERAMDGQLAFAFVVDLNPIHGEIVALLRKSQEKQMVSDREQKSKVASGKSSLTSSKLRRVRG
jgi:hypothetical protein